MSFICDNKFVKTPFVKDLFLHLFTSVIWQSFFISLYLLGNPKIPSQLKPKGQLLVKTPTIFQSKNAKS